MPKRLLILLLSIFCTVSLHAQDAKKSGIIKGKLINAVTKTPFNDVRVTLPQLNTFSSSEGQGNFVLNEVPYGNTMVVVGGGAAKRDTLNVKVDKDVIDLGEIMVTPNDRAAGDESSEIPTIAVEENNNQDDENASASSESSSGFYSANHDPFLRIAAITFGSYRFKPRGYDNADVQINGVPMQDLETGFSSVGQVGGLNDVLRDRSITYGLKPSEFTFGTTKGSTQINATAADQRKGTNVSYYSGNRTFRNRIMATYNTGVMKNGWAMSVSGSRRWAQEGYVPGTFYDGYSYYAAVSKLTKKSQFNLTAFGAPTKRGKSGSEQQEAFDLGGSHYYNSDWGYQEGKKRNSRVSDANQPVIIANYTYKPSDKMRWNTAFGYEFGKYKNSSIDFFNGYNPSPVYYRNLPGFYLTGLTPNPTEAAAVKANLLANPDLLQIDWARLYSANSLNDATVLNANGITGNTVTGKQSIYAMSNAVDDMKKLVFNSNIEQTLNEHITVYGGLQVISQKDEYYKQLTDLLGGDFFLNQNQFAVQTAVSNPNYNQNNLNLPNQLVKVGDKYGYNYILRSMHSNAWGQGVFIYHKFDFFAAAELGMVSFSREGLVKNGLFPDNSFGKSATNNFSTYKVKGGMNYKLDRKNVFYLNASYMTDAPRVDYTYISDKSRDIVVNNPTTVKTQTAELGFMHKSTRINLRASAYVNDVKDNTLIKRFFNDDPAFNTFINYVMQGVNTRSTGVEFCASVKLTRELSVTGLAAVGQAFYTDRPTVSVYQDNDPSKAAVSREVYIKNYYLGVGPQSIYCLDFSYRPRNYWHANLNLNYMDRNYVEVNPDRRTQQAADKVLINSPEWNKIYGQEVLPAAFTADINVGKSFDISSMYKKLHHKTLAIFNLGVVNVLNNTNIKVTGYEQLRYDYANHNADKFPNKYAYAYGINYYATLTFRF